MKFIYLCNSVVNVIYLVVLFKNRLHRIIGVPGEHSRKSAHFIILSSNLSKNLVKCFYGFKMEPVAICHGLYLIMLSKTMSIIYMTRVWTVYYQNIKNCHWHWLSQNKTNRGSLLVVCNAFINIMINKWVSTNLIMFP